MNVELTHEQSKRFRGQEAAAAGMKYMKTQRERERERACRLVLRDGRDPQAHLVAKRAHGAGLEPSLDAIQVEDVPAAAEGDRQAVLVVGRRVCLSKIKDTTTQDNVNGLI